MGSARKLCTQKREIELQSGSSVKKEFVFTSGRNKGRILGPYLAFRHPMNPFFYNKTRRRAPSLRASQGYRNHYSCYWRRYLLKSIDIPLKLFSITAIGKVSGAFEKPKRKIGMDLRKEEMERKTAKTKHPAIRNEKTEITPQKTSQIMQQKKPIEANIPEKPVVITETIMARAEPVAETPRIEEKVVKPVENRNDNKNASIVVKTEEIQTGSVKIVSKSVKQGKAGSRVYKTVDTTKTPRTSTIKVHAEDGRRNVGKPPNTSNSDFAWEVPSLSLFSISVRFPKMKPEGIIRTVEVKVPKAKGEMKVEETKGVEIYHVLNRARNRLLYPKIASGAADSLN